MEDDFYSRHTLLFFFLFCIWYLIVHSNVMMEQVLRGVPGTVEGNSTTTKGTLIQMTLMVFGYFALMALVSTVI
jgi:hypothetical protein